MEHNSSERPAMTAQHLDPEALERCKAAVLRELHGRRLLNDVDEDLHDEIADAPPPPRHDSGAPHRSLLGDHSVIVPRAITPVITKAYIAADPRRRRFAASAKRDWAAMISAAHDKGRTMAENSKIEWTDATWNPITGCTIKSPAVTIATR